MIQGVVDGKEYVIDGKVVRNVFIEDKYVGRQFYKAKNLLYRWVVGGVGPSRYLLTAQRRVVNDNLHTR